MSGSTVNAQTSNIPFCCAEIEHNSFNRHYTRDSTQDGPCRSEFWVDFMVIGPHWVKGLILKKN